jgi:hypothetical protein
MPSVLALETTYRGYSDSSWAIGKPLSWVTPATHGSTPSRRPNSSYGHSKGSARSQSSLHATTATNGSAVSFSRCVNGLSMVCGWLDCYSGSAHDDPKALSKRADAGGQAAAFLPCLTSPIAKSCAVFRLTSCWWPITGRTNIPFFCSTQVRSFDLQALLTHRRQEAIDRRAAHRLSDSLAPHNRFR